MARRSPATSSASLGVAPILGRALRRADDVTGAENVLVISHALWQRRYGGSRDVIGRRLTVSEQAVHDRRRDAAGASSTRTASRPG